MDSSKLAILGAGCGNCSCVALAPASMQSTRFPAGMTIFMYKGMGLFRKPIHAGKNNS